MINANSFIETNNAVLDMIGNYCTLTIAGVSRSTHVNLETMQAIHKADKFNAIQIANAALVNVEPSTIGSFDWSSVDHN